MKAYSVGGVTMLGVGNQRPTERGNCFSLKTDQGYIRIVNFYWENLETLLKRKLIY